MSLLKWLNVIKSLSLVESVVLGEGRTRRNNKHYSYETANTASKEAKILTLRSSLFF